MSSARPPVPPWQEACTAVGVTAFAGPSTEAPCNVWAMAVGKDPQGLQRKTRHVTRWSPKCHPKGHVRDRGALGAAPHCCRSLTSPQCWWDIGDGVPSPASLVISGRCSLTSSRGCRKGPHGSIVHRSVKMPSPHSCKDTPSLPACLPSPVEFDKRGGGTLAVREQEQSHSHTAEIRDCLWRRRHDRNKVGCPAQESAV